MGEIIEDKCGVVLAFSLQDTFEMMKDLQHRGREAAGIAAIGKDRIDVLKWAGEVRRFDREDLHQIFPGDDYFAYMGHVRYATRGQKDLQAILQDAHPHTLGGKVIDNGNHRLVLDCQAAMVHNGQVQLSLLEDKVSKSILQTGCDTEALLHYYHEAGERELLRNIPGAYTLIIADKSKTDILVLRDPVGIRLGMLGFKDDKFCVASEDVAIRKNGGKVIGDLVPGAVYYFASNGKYVKDQVIPKEGIKKNCLEQKELDGYLEQKTALCFFEFLYLSHPQSVIEGRSVQGLRQLLGKELAKEFKPADADLVTYVPRSPEMAAQQYAEELGTPFVKLFYKLNGERSFMGSTARTRAKSIDENLFLRPNAISAVEGKHVVVIDDSIVRGNVLKRVRKLLMQEAGAAKVTVCSYTPPIGIVGEDGIPRGCEYGVDMPPEDKFISRIIDKEDGRPLHNATLEEISRKAGMSVHYLSHKGLAHVFEQVGLPFTKLCSYCIGGKRPY